MRQCGPSGPPTWSVPTPIDTLERRAQVLEVEKAALQRENDKRSRQRLPEVEREIAELKEQASGMKARWQHEREVIKSLGDKKHWNLKPQSEWMFHPVPPIVSDALSTSDSACFSVSAARLRMSSVLASTKRRISSSHNQ